MRLLLISDSYPPLIGGATRAAQQLAYAMDERGHQVEVVTVWQPGQPYREEDGPVVVHRVRSLTHRIPGFSADPYRLASPPYPDPELVWRIRRIVKSFDPQLVHVYGWLSYSLGIALLGRRVPVLLSAREYANFCPLRTLVRNDEVCSGPSLGKCVACSGSYYGRVKGTVATVSVFGGRPLIRRMISGLHSSSHYVQERVHEHLVDPAAKGLPDRVLPDFRDPEDPDARPDPEILAQLPDRPFILFVGALRKIKGLEQLFKAYSELADPPPLVLMGHRAPDTPQAPPGVLVFNEVPHATVMAAWERAMFGVFPSLLPEPLGNVIHEAMSRGRAVIGTKPGGHNEMIREGENGLLVPSGDIGALTGAMRALIDDDDLRERMGRRGLELAEDFSAAQVIPGFERLYEEVESLAVEAQ